LIIVWRGVQVMKLLIIYFAAVSCHFISLQTKYSPQHRVLKRHQSMLLPQCQRPSFATICNYY
jgi:hypothetical protein